MKKIIILIIILAVLGGLWYWGTTGGGILEDDGTLATGSFGRVELPISASGEARERQRIEIKAEASGAIIEIAVEEGDVVQPDQLLIRLDTEEEQRNVDRTQAALDQAQADLRAAELAYDQTVEDQPRTVEQLQVALEMAQAQHDHAEGEWEHYKEASEGVYNPRELSLIRLNYIREQGRLKDAQRELKAAIDDGPRLIEAKKRQWEAAQARLKQTEFSLGDAQRRLRKTEIRNNYKSPCRVVRIHVSEGQVVSSATTVIGGNVLMELADVTAMEVEARVDEADIDKVVQMMADGRTQREAALAAAGSAAGMGEAGPAHGNDGTNGRGDPRGDPAGDDEPAGDRPHLTSTPAAPQEVADDRRFRDEVDVRFDALSGRTFRGRIIEIAQKPITVSQIITFEVRVRLYEHPEIESIRLGMQGTVDFPPVFEEGFCVPYEAVHRIHDKNKDRFVVKVPDPADPRGEPLDRLVEVGLTDGSRVVVRSGLAEGEQFYTKLPRRVRREE